MRLRTRVKRVVRQRVRRKVTGPLKRRARREIRKRPLFTCGSCGKKYNNVFGHRCSNGGDFGKRKRAARRAAEAEAAKAKRAGQRKRVNERVENARRAERRRANQRVRAERERARQRVKAARASRPKPRRPGRPAHDYRNCRDADCERVACEAYREGVEDGMDAERAQ